MHIERPEETQLVFHKALRHFMAKPMLTCTEERVLIQRAIKTDIDATARNLSR